MRPFTATLAIEDVLPRLPPRYRGERSRFKSFPVEDTAFETLVEDLFARTSEITGVPITNAVLDFRELFLGGRPTHAGTAHSFADGDHRGGWVTPDLYHVGCVARESARSEVRDGFSCEVRRYFRGLTFLSLDAPTVSDLENSRKPNFWHRVITPLLGLPPERNTFDRWFEVFFRHCARKPVALFSAEPPSNLIQQAAAGFGVQLVHVPLHVIACEAVVAHHTFHLIDLTRSQWETMIAILRAAEGPTSAPGNAGTRDTDQRLSTLPPRSAHLRQFEDTRDEEPKIGSADTVGNPTPKDSRPDRGSAPEAPPRPARSGNPHLPQYTDEEREAFEAQRRKNPKIRYADSSEFNPLTIVGAGRKRRDGDH